MTLSYYNIPYHSKNPDLVLIILVAKNSKMSLNTPPEKIKKVVSGGGFRGKVTDIFNFLLFQLWVWAI